MRRSLPAILIFSLTIVGLSACKNKASESRVQNLKDLEAWFVPEYAIDGGVVNEEIKQLADTTPIGMYADAYTRTYYQNEHSTLVWITRMGLSSQADSLLTFTQGAMDIGLSPTAFHTDTLSQMLRRMREYDLQGQDVSRLMGRMEFLLTQTYLRYACGQRYGYVNPSRLFNHLLVDEPAAGEIRRSVVYRQLYDHNSEVATDSFMLHALEQARHGKIGDFLRSVQPTAPLYQQMREEYLRASQTCDTTRTRLARINLERTRWRYPHPTGKRYVWVNLAPQQLTAVNGDSIISMRVCCGNQSHKTPLLHSEIRLVELNPYWVIPQTIVRKEIMPRHVGDSAYFARNSYQAIDKETKEEVDPASLTAAQLRSARYTLRQEKGAGNSLGRIIFRFPNNFSVYLHDTNNHGAFQRANRAISHGCVRVERPLDMAVFFLNQPTEFFIDRIRIALDLAPLSAQGRHYKQANPEAKPMNNFFYDDPIPLWLDYWTLYPSPSGQWESHADPYGYDKVIEKSLNAF